VKIGPPPDAHGEKLVDEWFTDLPWHQKLSTKDSNLIDMPFVMPAAAIKECAGETDLPRRARCMLDYGIVNVMAFHRTDTLYEPGDASELDTTYKQDCSKGDCVQVRLDIQRLHSTGPGPNDYAAEPATNNTIVYDGKNPTDTTQIQHNLFASSGFAITESTIFAPWRPWYMGHYCATDYDHMSDAVCYEDYWTTQFVAAVDENYPWLIERPALFWPQSKTNPNLKGSEYGRFCETGNTTCSMYLGKVKFLPDVSLVPLPTIDPNINPAAQICDPTICLKQVNDKSVSLDEQFTSALKSFVDINRFPWGWNNEKDENAFKPDDSYKTNPFIGYYEMAERDTDTTLEGTAGTKQNPKENEEGIPPDDAHYLFKATYVLPKQCTQKDFANARLNADGNAISHLKDCSLNFEVHTNGFVNAWDYFYGGNGNIGQNYAAIDEVNRMTVNGLSANQYGRTMFFYAGIPEQTIPAAFEASVQGGTGTVKIFEQMYGSSLYTQYLPMVNPNDQSPRSKGYVDDFWHAFFMSNHMNQTPDHFIRGIRGRTLWHNEYRANMLYKAEEVNPRDYLKDTRFYDGEVLAHVDFPAGFQKENATSPYHGNTCDSCHIRNGSGIPLQPNGTLPELHQHIIDKANKTYLMNANYFLDPLLLDYTYTNKEKNGPDDPNNDPKTNPTLRKQIVTPMKLVLFDPMAAADQCDASGHTAAQAPYGNKIMNFYGNSFHLNQLNQGKSTYQLNYTAVDDSDGFYTVDKTTSRFNQYSGVKYPPQRPTISGIETSQVVCNDKDLPTAPNGVDPQNWPTSCADVNGTNLQEAIDQSKIGIMHLMGKRLGNTPLIEMIPDAKIRETVSAQQQTFTYAGCYGKVAGTRAGLKVSDENYQNCTNPSGNNQSEKCYISRWGWIGDRASLEDQIANAAHVEMNISSKEGSQSIHPDLKSPIQEVRYSKTLCGPADVECQKKAPNSDITEQEIRNMATYQRWIGIPNRSRYQVATSMVVEGEKVFRQLKCNTCHVIDKIPFVWNDNMLPDEERNALKRLQNKDIPDYPFVSYLGTDLLMHDMGYLSQVVKGPVNAPTAFRNAEDGTINKAYAGYIQKIRTPPLKGLRFNRFVTDSNHNSKTPIHAPKVPSQPKGTNVMKDQIAGCDFLLHDGRACDAIEAAYLHDGPAVKKLQMIENLHDLSDDQLAQLRAFLYSL